MRRFSVGLLLLAFTACAPAAKLGPTPVPEPPEVRALARGIAVSGHGIARTDPISPQYDSGLNVGIDVVSLSHDGHSTFVVSVIQDNGGTETLTSAIGPYQGQRPLVVSGPVAFQVTADGNWSLTVQPIPQGGTPNFQGSGDAVGGYFTPPPAGQWQLMHDGQSAFYVYAHCLGGSVLVANSQGAVQTTSQVEFPRGPCFWEVRADGNWTLQPS
jgi:hypothetical protein